MPTASDILSGLYYLANTYANVALIWHILFAGLVISLWWGRKLPNRLLALFSVFPLLSVSALAWVSGNLFNGSVFLLFAVLLLISGLRVDTKPVLRVRGWPLATGILVLVFGLVYPHFLETGTFWRYLYAAPLGVIPCPTLSAVTGLALIFRGYGSRNWSLSLCIIGLFYGVFGAFRLGVTMDVVLLAGASALLLYVFQKKEPAVSPK